MTVAAELVPLSPPTRGLRGTAAERLGLNGPKQADEHGVGHGEGSSFYHADIYDWYFWSISRQYKETEEQISVSVSV